MTPPFFSGTKTVFVDNAPYFLSREHKGELSVRVLQLWGEGKKDEAARLFLDFLLLEGWTQERWDRLKGPLSATQFNELFGGEGKEVREEVEELFAFCRSRGADLNRTRGGEGHRLMEFLEQGLPPWAFLLITAPHVDRRTRLYKRFEEKRAALDLAPERERSGRIAREALAEFLDRRVKEAGKRVEPQAREMILARAGNQFWAVNQELEKLFLYVGEESWIRLKDVEGVFLDQGEGWVFDLTKALAARDSVGALTHLARLLSQGNHPLALLGPIANEVRRLLAARQLMEGELRERWKAGMSYPQFQHSMVHDGAAPLPGNPYSVYMSFKGAENFTLKELVRYLDLLYQTDIRLKSTGNPHRMVMERLILEMCREE
jgi:DNA polymerase-3 subunit delta